MIYMDREYLRKFKGVAGSLFSDYMLTLTDKIIADAFLEYRMLNKEFITFEFTAEGLDARENELITLLKALDTKNKIIYDINLN